MATDKRLETLQEEIKLLKGELKHSLASVRDYLLNQELPSADLAGGLYGDGEQKITMKAMTDTAGAAASGLGTDVMSGLSDSNVTEETPPEDEELLSVESSAPEGEIVSEEGPGAMGAPEETVYEEEEAPEDIVEELSEEPEDDEYTGESGGEGAPLDYVAVPTNADPGTPRVNMLANLITWVAKAKKEIGREQLATFLEVYGLSGHLSTELKDVILHFAEIATDSPNGTGSAEVWSQAMLSLHGILTGGDAPLHPLVPAWAKAVEEEAVGEDEEELVEVEKPPLKLKLVLPDAEGNNREYCIDLSPEAEPESPPKKRKERKSSREE